MKTSFVILTTFLVTTTSCKDKDQIGRQDVIDAKSEAVADAYFQYTDEITRATFEGATGVSNDYFGINFGDGNTDAQGNIRKGNLVYQYSNGPASSIGFTVVLTYSDFSINGIKLEGQRTYVKVTPSATNNVKYSVTMANGKVTWPDNSFITRNAENEREADPNGTITVTGGATGLTRAGKEYTAAISKGLVHTAPCAITSTWLAEQGIKLLTTNHNMTIDYGNNICDQKITISNNGQTKEIVVDAN